MRVTRSLELELVLQTSFLIFELDALLGAVLLRLQLALLVLADVGDADLLAEGLEHLVLDAVHLRLQLLDLVAALVHRLLDRADARLQRTIKNAVLHNYKVLLLINT